MRWHSNQTRSESTVHSWAFLVAIAAFVVSAALETSVVVGQEIDSAPAPPGDAPANVEATGAPQLQSSDQEAEEYVPSEEELAEFERRVQVFRNESRTLAKNLAERRAIYIRYSNGEDQRPEVHEEYRYARQRARESMDRTYAAALSATGMGFQQEALTYIATMVEHRHSIGLYDQPTLLGAILMINGGSKLIYAYEAAARSAIVCGQFDLARRVYESLDIEASQGLDSVLAMRIDAFEHELTVETEIRKREKEEDRLPRVKLETTQGDIVMELFLDHAPSTVSHFISLVESGFYDELEFVQVLKHLLALAGDPTDTGKSAPDRYLMDEHRRQDARFVFRGSVIMAKASTGEENKYVPNSANTEFAIMLMPVRSFAKDHTVFGRVIEGMDVVSRLRYIDPNKERKDNEVVLPPDRIINATVTRHPDFMPRPDYFIPPPRR